MASTPSRGSIGGSIRLVGVLLGLRDVVGQRHVGPRGPARRALPARHPVGRGVLHRLLPPLPREVRSWVAGCRDRAGVHAFAAARGLPLVSLPQRPSDAALVRMAHDEDRGETVAQLRASGADLVVPSASRPPTSWPISSGMTGSSYVAMQRMASGEPAGGLSLARVAAAETPGSTSRRLGEAPPDVGGARAKPVTCLVMTSVGCIDQLIVG